MVVFESPYDNLSNTLNLLKWVKDKVEVHINNFNNIIIQEGGLIQSDIKLLEKFSDYMTERY